MFTATRLDKFFKNSPKLSDKYYIIPGRLGIWEIDSRFSNKLNPTIIAFYLEDRIWPYTENGLLPWVQFRKCNITFSMISLYGFVLSLLYLKKKL